jgi:hypothetical protein
MNERFSVGHRQHQGDRAIRGDRGPGSGTGFDTEVWITAQCHRHGSPGAHHVWAAAADPGPAVALSEAGIELDDGVDGSALGRQAAHQQRCRQQVPGDLGHHRLGEGESAAADRPGRLQCRGAVPVAAIDDPGRPRGPDPEPSGRRSADKPAEDGLAVEAGQAEPVDRALAGHERRGAGVAEQPVVLERRWPVGAHQRACRRSPRTMP